MRDVYIFIIDRSEGYKISTLLSIYCSVIYTIIWEKRICLFLNYYLLPNLTMYNVGMLGRLVLRDLR